MHLTRTCKEDEVTKAVIQHSGQGSINDRCDLRGVLSYLQFDETGHPGKYKPLVSSELENNRTNLRALADQLMR